MSFISTVKILLMSAIAPLAGFYVFQAGDIVWSAHSSTVYRVQSEEVREQNNVLQNEAFGALSLESVEAKARELSFVPVVEVKYLATNAGRLAKAANIAGEVTR